MTDSPSSNLRLYLALYIRDGVSPHSQAEDRFHWALLAIPANKSNTQATRFHARDYFNTPSQTHWIYEEVHTSTLGTPKLLSQSFIRDVVNEDGLLEILRDAPIRQEKGWNCVSWVENAVNGVWEEGVVEMGKYSRVGMLKDEALRAADEEVARRDGIVKALL